MKKKERNIFVSCYCLIVVVSESVYNIVNNSNVLSNINFVVNIIINY